MKKARLVPPAPSSVARKIAAIENPITAIKRVENVFAILSIAIGSSKNILAIVLGYRTKP